jgi:hypothetical protein
MKSKNPDKFFHESNFDKAKRPTSISPERRDYTKRAIKRADSKSKCIYIHPQTGKRCKNLLGLYTEYCELHTMLINNVYIAISQISRAGNGLYAGPYGFEKGDIIGEYSKPWNKVDLKTLEKRCKTDSCWDYVLCDGDKCWDGLDIRSTLMRNINDARNTKFRNNSFFENRRGKIYVVASHNIKPHSEIFVDYGDNYW